MPRKKAVQAEQAVELPEVSPQQVIKPSSMSVIERGGVTRVVAEKPLIGCKSFLIEKKGIYVFEEGQGVLRSLAVTYVGSGGIKIYDGVPSESGHFDFEGKMGLSGRADVRGRRIFVMTPQIIGFWGLDAGFSSGLTVVADGGQATSPVLVTVMWEAYNPSKISSPEIEYGED